MWLNMDTWQHQLYTVSSIRLEQHLTAGNTESEHYFEALIVASFIKALSAY